MFSLLFTISLSITCSFVIKHNNILLFIFNFMKNPEPVPLLTIILQTEGLTLIIFLSNGFNSELSISTSFIL